MAQIIWECECSVRRHNSDERECTPGRLAERWRAALLSHVQWNKSGLSGEPGESPKTSHEAPRKTASGALARESGDFNFESKYTRVCAKHFDASDIVTTYDFNINGDAVSLERDKPTLKADAVPSIFGGLPSYLTKRKPRPRSSTNRSPRKRARESSCETEEQRASPTTCSDRTDAASVNEADVALTSETVETYHTDTACQTDRLVDCASCAAVQKLRCQLRAAKQQLRQCQTKLAEFRKKTAKYERQQQSLQRLSDREKLIIDQCVMKANAKSARAVRYKKDWLYDCLLLKTKSTSVYTYLQENNFLPLPNPRTLYCYMKSLKADFGFDAHVFTVLKEKLLTSPESERRGLKAHHLT
ncbi:uncharacterized protein LOC142788261 [Rhipicephalus microplus]|uniref:uncharacterized protein LOC142788261 n=1 Tax=Rhipicephalus microplus TaxID=6941 RepID=UPI003F6CC216